MVTRLVVAAVYSMLIGTLYLYIGRQIARRRVEGPARVAQGAFVAWWVMIGLTTLLGGLQVGLFAADRLPIWLYQTIAQTALLFLSVSLWGLLYYLMYIYTGNSRTLWPLTVGYTLFYILILALIAWAEEPRSIIDGGWTLKTLPEPELGSWVILPFLLLLIGPQFAAAVAFIRLYRKVDDPNQRYRIAMVGWSILVWFGSSLVVGAFSAGDSGISESDAWQVISRLIGLGAALAMLFAYKPPAWIQRRYGVTPVVGKPAPPLAPKEPPQ